MIQRRGYVLLAFWLFSTILFAVTSDDGSWKSAVGIGACVTFAGAFLVMGVVGWVRDLGAKDNPGFRESKRQEHACARSWAAAMLPFSFCLAVLATSLVFAAYDEVTVGDTLAQVLLWVFVAGVVVSFTIGQWRQPRFLVSAEGRREAREAKDADRSSEAHASGS